jgi:hypothetical protein
MVSAEAIYTGEVRHRRFTPVGHAFRYRLCMLYLDTERIESRFRGSWLWSTKRPAPGWFRRSDFLGDPARDLGDCVRDLVEAETGNRPGGPVMLLANLRYFGKLMNPIACYYSFEEDGETLAAVVAEAYELSNTTKIKPHLILSVMAIESSFHPYIQSPAGAQGLMQVMTDIHVKKYEKYGGKLAAFDPLTNMRVGTQVLQEYIRLKGGVTEDGLLFYLGGDTLQSDTGYVAKVLAEEARLDQVAAGQKVSTLP